jgi:hypothetical protein
MTEPVDKLSYKKLSDESGGGLSMFDYFYMVRASGAVHEDFIMSFAAVFNPTIVKQRGGFFVKENFNSKRYEELLEGGVERSDIPYWLNMLELTDFLGDVSYDYAAELGAVVCECWSSKLEKKFPNSGFEARLVLEDELDEVWVTLCKVSVE